MAKTRIEEPRTQTPTPPPTQTGLATTTHGGLEIPGGMELLTELPEDFTPSSEGTDDIRADEIKLPRLAIAQGLSPQMSPDDPKFIDGLRLFEFFNDLTGEIYGRGPLYFVAVRRTVARIEFRPRKEGGGVIDMDVPLGDVRLEWTANPETGKKDVPPKATVFTEAVSFLLKPDRTIEPIVISIKNTNKSDREAAKRLTSFMKALVRGMPVPIYGKVYRIEAKTDKNDKGTFGVHTIAQAGFTPKLLQDAAKKFRDSLEGKVIRVERQPGDEDVAFDPNEM